MNETAYTLLLIAVEVLFLALCLRTLRAAGMRSRAMAALGTGTALWLGLAYVLLAQNRFSAAAVPEVPFAAMIAGPIVLGLVAQRTWEPLRTAVDVLPVRAFLSLQQMRFPFGVMFFLADGLPLWFQLVGGLGDMAAGVGASIALRRLRIDPRRVDRAIVEGNLIGILDFAVVFTLAFAVVIPHEPTALDDMFNLIPTVVVPVFILLHVFSLQGLVEGRQRETT